MFPGGTFQKSNNYWDCEAVKVKKKTIRRGLFGLPIGITIGFVITLIISACVGDGSFYPVTPELIGAMGNELNAVILQTVLCAIMGAGFAAASVIWELDSWSLAKQSGIYFLTISIIMLPVAYFANWMKHSLAGVLSYVGIFTAIFCCCLDLPVPSLEAEYKEDERLRQRGGQASPEMSASAKSSRQAFGRIAENGLFCQTSAGEKRSQKAVGSHPFTDAPPTAFYWNRYQAKVIRRCRARP